MQQPYHQLLEKQIANTLSGAQKYDPAVQQLLKLVDQAYRNFDTEQKLTERAFQECEKEYQNILHNLQLQNNPPVGKEIERCRCWARSQGGRYYRA